MPKTDPLLEAATRSLSLYLYLVHDTDMPQVHGGKAMPMPHHQDMIDVLVQDGYGHSLILAPRGAAKTKLLQAYIEWKLGRASLGLDGFGRNWARDFRVGWISASASKAYGVSNAIRETIEFNPIFQAMFPKVKKHKDKWSEGEWKVRGNPTKDANFIAAGRGGAILGSRFHMIVPDDIAGEDERSSDLATATKPRLDLIFWIENTLLKCLVPDGRIMMAATRWYEGDPPDWAMEQGWHVLKIQALTDCDGSCENEVADVAIGSEETPSGVSSCLEKGGDADDMRRTNTVLHEMHEETRARNDVRVGEGGKASCPGEHSFWPERWSAEKLMADRKKNPRSFALQMQNDIIPSQGMYFQREWFNNRYDWAPAPEQLRQVFATWDTAGKRTGRSYTVGLVVALTKDWRYYIMALYRAKLQAHEVREIVRDVANRWKVSETIIEDKSSGSGVLDELAYQKLSTPAGDGIYGGLRAVLPKGQRGGPAILDFVEEVTIPCAEGRIWLPSTDFIQKHDMEDWRDVFLKELIQYPEGQNDDIVVALTQLLFVVEKNRREFEMMERELMVPQLAYGRSEEQAALV